MTCSACGENAPDGLLCGGCTTQLRKDLRQLADLLPDLEDMVAGRLKFTTGGKIRGTGSTGLPFNEAASETRWAVSNTLLTWCRDLDLGDLYGQVRDDPADWAWWLLARIERIRGHAAAGELADEIGFCAGQVRRAVDRPLKRTGCGKCPVCGVDVWALGDDQTGVCKGCEAVLPVLTQQPERWEQAEQIPMRRRDLVEAMRINGLHVKPATLRQWVKRGHLTPVDYLRGTPLYLLADARRLAGDESADERAS